MSPAELNRLDFHPEIHWYTLLSLRNFIGRFLAFSVLLISDWLNSK